MPTHDPNLDLEVNQAIDRTEELIEMFDVSMKDLVRNGTRMIGREPSCKTCREPGCCTITVFCTLQEALPIARYLRLVGRDTPEFRTELRAYGEDMEGTPQYEWMAQKRPCPLLRDKRCSVYDLRPSSCRGYFAWTPAFLCSVPDSNVQIQSMDTTHIAHASILAGQDFARHSLGVPDNRLYMGTVARMVALALELLGDRQHDGERIRKEPFPDCDTKRDKDWFKGNNYYSRRRHAEAARSK